MLAAVGIKINTRPQTSQATTDMNVAGEWDMQMDRNQDFLLPFTRCNNLAPLTKTTPNWNREGAEARVLRDWEQELADTASAYCKEQDPATRKELLSKYNNIFTMHNYAIGTIIGRKGLALAERFMNVPGGTPPYMYQWVEDVMMSEMTWTPVEQQKEQVRPNTLPDYGN